MENFIKKKEKKLNFIKNQMKENNKEEKDNEDKELTFKPKINKNNNKKRTLKDLYNWKKSQEKKKIIKLEEKIKNEEFKFDNKKINIKNLTDRLTLWDNKIKNKKEKLNQTYLKNFFSPKINNNFKTIKNKVLNKNNKDINKNKIKNNSLKNKENKIRQQALKEDRLYQLSNYKNYNKKPDKKRIVKNKINSLFSKNFTNSTNNTPIKNTIYIGKKTKDNDIEKNIEEIKLLIEKSKIK